MGKSQKKSAKGRLDKFLNIILKIDFFFRWYRLAKEQGFRSRAAYKLIQLNRKYNFLDSCKVLIDLCAAPGGWLQVASREMPVNAFIIGVDLVPIKPIPRCITVVDDITTPSCKTAIRQYVKDYKVY
jgi:AdoMet-dependent rRNA methyltransferase SPB1